MTCPANVTYTGSAQTPCTVTVTGAGGLNQTPTPSYSNNTNAGTATASYTYAGDANHEGSSDSKNFTIDQAASVTVVELPGERDLQWLGADALLGERDGGRRPRRTRSGGQYASSQRRHPHGASAYFAGDPAHDGSQRLQEPPPSTRRRRRRW